MAKTERKKKSETIKKENAIKKKAGRVYKKQQ